MRKAATLLILSLYLLVFATINSNLPGVSPKLYASAPIGSTDFPWTMFHHDSLRTGATPANAPNAASLMWTVTTGSFVYASPAVVNGVVFIPSWDGKLYAIDEFSGMKKWDFSTGGPIYSSPAVSDGIVYLASQDRFVYALNEQTGGPPIWQILNIRPVTSSPVVADGKVFYGTWFDGFKAELLAIDAFNGTILWKYYADDTIISSPSVHNGRVFFGQNNGYVVALNETSGMELWKVPAGGNFRVRTAPAVAYGIVFVGTDKEFVALDELTGATIWTFNTAGSAASSGAVNNGIVYFGTGKGNVRAVNATTGVAIWTYPTGGAVSSSPALTLGSNALLVGSSDRYLYALNMTTGALFWRYLTGGAVSSSPAVADGRVFFGSEDFKVYALGPQAPSLQASISASKTSLKPGELSILTITVTNGTAPQSEVTFLQTSSQGGGFTQPTEKSPGVYVSNYTSRLVSSSIDTIIRVVASKSGYLDGSAQMTITLNPFPPLTVAVTPKPATVSPGGEIVLLIRVTNGTQPTVGASIFLSSTGGGAFSGIADGGNGNYTVIYTTPLQNSNPTVTVQASKPGFSSGIAQATITVSGLPDLTTIKFFDIPLFLLLAGLFLLIFVIFVALIAKRKNEFDYSPRYTASYALRVHPTREGLFTRFRAALPELAAIAGS